MLFILALLFFPCAVVGAFVTADDHDLMAFQVGIGGGLFSSMSHPIGGALRGPSRPVAKDVVPAARTSSSCTRERRAPVVTMLVNDASSIPSIRSLGARSMQDANNANLYTSAITPPSALLVWPAASAGGVLSDILSRRKHRRGRAAAGSENSESALKAMSIPARCALPSVDLLREAYGPRRNFWGDLSARETRIFYKELLPVSIKLEALARRGIRDVNGKFDNSQESSALASAEDSGSRIDGDGGVAQSVFGGGGVLSLEEQARLASTARHAARLYARERCALPSRVVAHLYDGLRHLKNYGTFRVTGMTWEELWAKYEAQVREENPSLAPAELKERVCLRILEKSCCTSQAFDNIAGLHGRELEEIDADVNTRDESEIFCATATAAAVSSVSAVDVAKSNCGRLEASASASAATAAGCDDILSYAEPQASEDLERASALESAAAVAGVLRLTRLVKPFGSAKEDAAQNGRTRCRPRKPPGRPRFSARS